MASRRFANSALRAFSSFAFARPATSVIATATARARAAPLAIHFRRDLVFGGPTAVSRRSYSVSKDDVVPNSRLWNFEELKTLVEKNDGGEGKNIVIVDVREPVELFETGKIPGAINIPITTAVQSFHISEEDFEEVYGFDRPPKDTELLFYCKAGVRARAAAALAQSAGWENVGEYPGSWLDWAEKNGPVEKVEQK